jgi:uncharacterized protein
MAKRRAIDFLCNHFTPESIRKNYSENEEEAARFEQVGLTGNLKELDPKAFMDKMTDLGVEYLLVPSIVTWSYWQNHPVEHTTVEEVISLRKMFPKRVFGLYGIDPRKRMDGVRELEMCVKEHDFRGVHLHPHGFGHPPNHSWYFPYYAKCEELGVAVVISMGHTIDLMPIENGRPIHLDEIALYFPRLQIVCGHTGWPWIEEAIAVAWKHPNVHIGTSAYKPRYWDPKMVHFLNSFGRGKVMWGTDYPLIQHEEALEQIDNLKLRDESREALLFGTAAKVFKLG